MSQMHYFFFCMRCLNLEPESSLPLYLGDRASAKFDSRKLRRQEGSGSTTAPVPRISFALEHLDKVCWARRHGLGVFALAVSSYTATRGIAKGRYVNIYMSFFTRDFLRETGPSKRARFRLIDLLLAAMIIILVVLVVRDLMYRRRAGARLGAPALLRSAL